MADRRGQRLGNYTLVQLLGRGGFADVYLAEHVYLKTQVAVKVLQTRFSTTEDMNSFLREAQLIARLSHPHIIRVLDFGLDGDIPFLVMDYAPGGTLRQQHQRGKPLPLPLIISYVKQLADALHYAHEEKVIHRDLKQENMLSKKHHEVLLSDFGIALIAQSSRYQGTQEVAGTVAYMAPEQIQGKPRTASDQYALGIITYEWISGDRPFHGSFTEICAQHLFVPPPPLREKVPTLSPSVEQVLSLALAKDPKQRFANVQAFAHALELAAQSPEPIVLTSQSDSSPIPTMAQPDSRTQHEEGAVPVFAPGEPKASPTPSLPPTLSVDPPALPPAPTQEFGRQQILQQRPGTPAHVVSVWKFGGRQQIWATVMGIVLFGSVCYLLDLFFLAASNDGYSSSQYQTFWLIAGVAGFSLMNIALGSSLIIPAFFAAKFGPWVGLVTATVGNLLGNVFSDTLSAPFNPWYTYITYAIFGFVAGLVFMKTHGRYTTRGAFLPLAVITIISLVTCLGWQTLADNSFNPPAPVASFYLPMTLIFCFPGLLLLFSLLIAYEKVVPYFPFRRVSREKLRNM